MNGTRWLIWLISSYCCPKLVSKTNGEIFRPFLTRSEYPKQENKVDHVDELYYRQQSGTCKFVLRIHTLVCKKEELGQKEENNHDLKLPQHLVFQPYALLKCCRYSFICIKQELSHHEYLLCETLKVNYSKYKINKCQNNIYKFYHAREVNREKVGRVH
jgi:hypothetical protein